MLRRNYSKTSRTFALSGVDIVDIDGVGSSGGAERPAGHKNYSITGLGPVVLDNEFIDKGSEMPDVFRDCPAARYDAVMQAHLPARPFVGAKRKYGNIDTCLTEKAGR